MKSYIVLLAVCVVAIIGLIIGLQYVKSLKTDLNIAVANEKAALAEKDSLKNQSIVYQYTIEQLNFSNDSILDKLKQARDGLKIRDKKIKELAYLATTAKTTDTLILRDTIFRDKEFVLDTTIGDEWYKCELGLKYPNVISLSPEFKSEKEIVVSTKRETIYPPKKCWLGRLFQKKHTVIEVNIVEESPYVETTESKFIQIIK